MINQKPGGRERRSKRKRERDTLLLIRGDDQPKTEGLF